MKKAIPEIPAFLDKVCDAHGNAAKKAAMWVNSGGTNEQVIYSNPFAMCVRETYVDSKGKEIKLLKLFNNSIE